MIYIVDSKETEIENLKNAFIVDTANYDEKRLADQLRILIKHAAIDKSGKVLIKNKNLTGRQKVLLILIARFVANKLGEEVPAEVSIEDVSENGYMEKTVAGARLNDVVNEGTAVRLARGTFQIRPFKIDEILGELEGSKKSE